MQKTVNLSKLKKFFKKNMGNGTRISYLVLLYFKCYYAIFFKNLFNLLLTKNTTFLKICRLGLFTFASRVAAGLVIIKYKQSIHFKEMEFEMIFSANLKFEINKINWNLQSKQVSELSTMAFNFKNMTNFLAAVTYPK